MTFTEEIKMKIGDKVYLVEEIEILNTIKEESYV